MAERTGIEWCDSTWNPWIGCTKVSPACDHCYAADSTPARTLGIAWGAGQPRRRTSPGNWALPLRWNQQPFVECMACGWRGECRDCHAVQNPAGFHPPVAEARLCPQCIEPLLKEARRRVFCASLADVFDNEVPAAWRADLLHLIFKTPNLDWLLLTKRIGNANVMLERAVADVSGGDHSWSHQASRGFRHVWLGATICNQAEAERDVPKLLTVPACRRFVSMEPLLGLVDLERACNLAGPRGLGGCRYGLHLAEALDWVITGGESGPHARPMHPEWLRSLRDQCAAAEVPFLFKQWGEFASVSEVAGEGRHHQFPDGATVRRVGKKAAGRLLDGKLHDAFPEVARG